MSNHRDVTPSNILALILIGAISSAVGIAIGLAIDWFPAAAASQAGPIDLLYDVTMVISVVIFVGVTELALFMVWKFRMRRGEEDLDGPNMHGSTKLEIIWTAIPSALIAVLCVYAVNVLGEIDTAKADQVRVGVYGQQFAWQFEYRAPSGKKFLSDALWLQCSPTGNSVKPGSPCSGPQVQFDIKAVDVIHSFWVPELRMKQDAVPGITTHTKIDPTRIGTYSVVCSELCGIGHSIMRANVHVVPPAEYSAWLAKAASKS